MRRFLFPLPSVKVPKGGVNVILAMIDLLNDHGIEARALYASPDYAYPFFRTQAPALYDRRLAPVLDRKRLGGRLGSFVRLPRLGADQPNARLELRSEDIIVIPEFCYPELALLYPDHAKICLIQAVLSYIRGLERLQKLQDPRAAMQGSIATSESCVDAARIFGRVEPMRITLRVGHGRSSVDSKRHRIAFMPRKLPEQVESVVGALKRSPICREFEFAPLAGLTHEEVVKELGESLIFLSFPSLEGFGLPAAEAMANGCIVVGYTGVGGNEFFTSETGFPVEADDLSRFVRTVEDVVRHYDEDPEPLDALRRHASKFIRSTYSEARFRETTLQVFRNLDTDQLSS